MKRRRNKKMSSIKEQQYYITGDIRYIKFIEAYNKFDDWKENTK